MADKQITLPVEEATNAFFLRAQTFIVTGPTTDLSIQIAFCEDVIRHRSMDVSDDGSGSIKLQFDGQPARLVLGTAKLSLQGAKELVSLLNDHIQKVEEVLKTAGA
jgi:hypothetical protein